MIKKPSMVKSLDILIKKFLCKYTTKKHIYKKKYDESCKKFNLLQNSGA